MLVEAGADVDAEDRWGNTPLDDATHAQAMPVVQYLTQFVSDDQDADLIRLDSGESLDSRPRSVVRSRPTSARPVSAKSRPTSAAAASRVPSALLAHGSRRRRASGVVAEERDVQHVKLADMKSGSRALFVSTRNVVLGQVRMAGPGAEWRVEWQRAAVVHPYAPLLHLLPLTHQHLCLSAPDHSVM